MSVCWLPFGRVGAWDIGGIKGPPDGLVGVSGSTGCVPKAHDKKETATGGSGSKILNWVFQKKSKQYDISFSFFNFQNRRESQGEDQGPELKLARTTGRLFPEGSWG